MATFSGRKFSKSGSRASVVLLSQLSRYGSQCCEQILNSAIGLALPFNTGSAQVEERLSARPRAAQS
jgi:hypothetical protein